MTATGIDPAAVGCAARADVEIRDGVPVLVGWRAIRLTRRARMPWDCASPGIVTQALFTAGARRWLVDDCSDTVAVEGTPAFVRARGRGGQAIRSLVTQAEAAGAIVQALGVEPLRSPPDVWRPAVLLCPGNDPSAELAAMAALGWAEMRGARVRGWLSEVETPPAWAAPHVAEACAIGVWVARHASDPGRP